MHIDSGAAPLSLALLKALGSQAAPAAAAAKPTPAAAAAKLWAVQPEGAPAAARNLPRGSLVDLRA